MTAQILSIVPQQVEEPPSREWAGFLATRGSESNQRDYQYRMNSALKWAGYDSIPRLVEAFRADPYHLAGFIKSRMDAAGMEKNQQAPVLNMLRTFARYLVETGKMKTVPKIGVRTERTKWVDSKIPISEANIKQCRDFIATLTEPTRTLHRGILACLWPLGLRRVEILSIRADCIKHDTILIREKGHRNEWTEIPCPVSVILALKDLAEVVKARWPKAPNPYLFPSPRAMREQGAINKAMSAFGLNLIVQSWGNSFGLSGMAPHQFRHAVATYGILKHGWTVHQTAGVLRQSIARTQEIYYDSREKGTRAAFACIEV